MCIHWEIVHNSSLWYINTTRNPFSENREQHRKQNSDTQKHTSTEQQIRTQPRSPPQNVQNYKYTHREAYKKHITRMHPHNKFLILMRQSTKKQGSTSLSISNVIPKDQKFEILNFRPKQHTYNRYHQERTLK
jgi:hypothetical protein